MPEATCDPLPPATGSSLPIAQWVTQPPIPFQILFFWYQLLVPSARGWVLGDADCEKEVCVQEVYGNVFSGPALWEREGSRAGRREKLSGDEFNEGFRHSQGSRDRPKLL